MQHTVDCAGDAVEALPDVRRARLILRDAAEMSVCGRRHSLVPQASGLDWLKRPMGENSLLLSRKGLASGSRVMVEPLLGYDGSAVGKLEC